MLISEVNQAVAEGWIHTKKSTRESIDVKESEERGFVVIMEVCVGKYRYMEKTRCRRCQVINT